MGAINPPTNTVRGGFSASQKTVEVAPGITMTGRFPAAIVYLKPNAKAFRRFYRFIENNDAIGVVVHGADENGNPCKVVRKGGTKDVLHGHYVQGEHGPKFVLDDQSVCGDRHAWEVIGDSEVIARLLDDECVDHWHGIVSCSVRWQGQGDGTEKVKPSKPREKHQRDAQTRAVVVGNELNDQGERVAVWEMRKAE